MSPALLISTMLRRLSQSAGRPRVKHVPSTPSLRVAEAAPPVPARSLVSTVLLTAEGYESKQVTELRALLRQRNLASSGRKAELVQRLKQNDMQRAGSTLAAAAPKTSKPKPKAKAVPKGKEAAELAAAKMPAAPLEPGSVSSPAADADGTLGKASPSATVVPPHEPTTPPGRPSHKADPVRDTFSIKVPFEEPAEPVAQYIPSIKAYVDPAQDYSDSYKEEWHMPHVPRVHRLGAGDSVLSSEASFLEPAEPTAARGVLAELSADWLPGSVQRSAESSWSRFQRSTGGLVGDVLADLKRVTPLDPIAPQSNARPSARRPLNDEERTGAVVLGGVLLTGFALGGIAAAEDKEVVAEKKPAGYEPPHYVHGGQIVGGGVRKV